MRQQLIDRQQPVKYERGDYVLYRDPELFWRGMPDHTFVCRIEDTIPYTTGGTRYRLIPLNGGTIPAARSEYMHLLPPSDAMRDIDTAPLNTDAAPDDMTPAAVAWLTQQHTTANRRAELPPQN